MAIGTGLVFTGDNRGNGAGVFTAKYAKEREVGDQANLHIGFFTGGR
jgi:hypothetical protein